jgi:hypothetical protein
LNFKVLEDFETKIFTNENFKIYSNEQNTFEVKMSKLLVSDKISSQTSLLIQLKPNSSKQYYEFNFKEPYLVSDYIYELELNLYSDSSLVQFYILLEDTHFKRHKIKIPFLQIEEWNRIKIPLFKQIQQRDLIHTKRESVRISGFGIDIGDLGESKRDILIGIDDLNIYSLDKTFYP